MKAVGRANLVEPPVQIIAELSIERAARIEHAAFVAQVTAEEVLICFNIANRSAVTSIINRNRSCLRSLDAFRVVMRDFCARFSEAQCAP